MENIWKEDIAWHNSVWLFPVSNKMSEKCLALLTQKKVRCKNKKSVRLNYNARYQWEVD